MITAGIDIGIRYTKIVIMKDREVIAYAHGASGGIKRPENTDRLWLEALTQAELDTSDVQAVVSTGKGKYNTNLTDRHCTEVVALTKAVQALRPEATMAVNLGADEILVTVLDDSRKTAIAEMAQNQKCSAGLGLLIENLTEEFEWYHQQTSWIQNTEKVFICDGCATFARMDILEARNKGVSKEAVMAGVLNAAAVRANSVINDITFPNTENIVLSGGLGKNAAFVRLLAEKSKKTLEVCPEPEYVCAIGAALVAETKVQSDV